MSVLLILYPTSQSAYPSPFLFKYRDTIIRVQASHHSYSTLSLVKSYSFTKILLSYINPPLGGNFTPDYIGAIISLATWDKQFYLCNLCP